jgi:glycosyltransferase involved in cell wall biosynthesis
VVDDGSSDGTGEAAARAGARVIPSGVNGGNPAAARNVGARASTGDPIVFLDADCVPLDGWLEALLEAHAAGYTVVGGALDRPPGLSTTARCDYYCGFYLIHSGRPAAEVPHHPPPNLSVRRAPFLASPMFTEAEPFAYTNEERAWEGALRAAGHRIRFEPRAVVHHHNRPGLVNLMRRSYRWAYTAIEAKSVTGAARAAWLYRHPWLLVAAAPGLVVAHTVYIVGCWARAGVLEPLVMAPLVLASRCAYVAGMVVGGLRWLAGGRGGDRMRVAPRWR